MDRYQSVIAEISIQTGVIFRGSGYFELRKLKSLGLPKAIIAFFRKYQPTQCVEGQVRLWPIAEIVAENREFVPGYYVSKLGYVVFATSLYGDVYCFDLTTKSTDEPPVVLISHDEIYEETSTSEVAALAKPIAKDLLSFLQAFVRQEVDTECLYSEIENAE